MIHAMEVCPGIRLTAVKDSRFKQNCVSIQYIREMKAGENAMNALIPSVLLRGTRSDRDLRAITRRLDDLYGAAVSPISRRAGDYQTTGFYVSLMDDRFALDGDRVLERTLKFVKELLFDYPTEGGGFLPEFVEGEKINQIAAIESELNDKRVYASQRLMETMCQGDSYGLPRMGTVEEVQAITPQALLEQYLRLRRESPVLVYYVGSARPETVAEYVRDIFGEEIREPKVLPAQTGFSGGEKKDLRERMEVAQGKLCMGFTSGIRNTDPLFPAMQVFNCVFGGGMTSKLFQNIREKQSLCYSIGSSFYGAKGLVQVSAGIDFDKEAHVRREILRELDACRAGEISDEELSAGKEALLSALRGVQDSPAAIENYYVSIELAETGRSWEDHMAALEAVTTRDVVACARALELHSTYFLEGESK